MKKLDEQTDPQAPKPEVKILDPWKDWNKGSPPAAGRKNVDCKKGSQFEKKFQYWNKRSMTKRMPDDNDAVWPACVTCPDGYEVVYEYQGGKPRTKLVSVFVTLPSGDEKIVRANQFIPACEETKEGKKKRKEKEEAGKQRDLQGIDHSVVPVGLNEFHKEWLAAREMGLASFTPPAAEEMPAVFPCGVLFSTKRPDESEQDFRKSLYLYQKSLVWAKGNSDKIEWTIARLRGSWWWMKNDKKTPIGVTPNNLPIPHNPKEPRSQEQRQAVLEMIDLSGAWKRMVREIRAVSKQVLFKQMNIGPGGIDGDPANRKINSRAARRAGLKPCRRVDVGDAPAYKKDNWDFSFKQFYKQVKACAQEKKIEDPNKIVAPNKWEENYNFGPDHAKVYIAMKKAGCIPETADQPGRKAKWTRKDRIADLRGQSFTRKKWWLWSDKEHGQIFKALAFQKGRPPRPGASIKFREEQDEDGKWELAIDHISVGPGTGGIGDASHKCHDTNTCEYIGRFSDLITKWYGQKLRGETPVEKTRDFAIKAQLAPGTAPPKKKRKMPKDLARLLKSTPSSPYRFAKRLVGTTQGPSNHMVHVALAFEYFLGNFKADDYEVLLFPVDKKGVEAHKSLLKIELDLLPSKMKTIEQSRMAMFGVLPATGEEGLGGGLASSISNPIESIIFTRKGIKGNPSIQILTKAATDKFLEMFSGKGGVGESLSELPVKDNKGKQIQFGDKKVVLKDLVGGLGLNSLAVYSQTKCFFQGEAGYWFEMFKRDICKEVGKASVYVVPKNGKKFTDVERTFVERIGANPDSGIRYLSANEVVVDHGGSTDIKKEGLSFDYLLNLIDEQMRMHDE